MGENNISEDILLLNDFIEGNFQKDKLENYKGSYKMGYFYYKSIQQAIEHILSDYKRVLKENEKLKESNKIVSDLHCDECILKQIIKDKIENLKKVKERNIKRDFDTVYKDGYFTGEIDALQELLESEE